MNARVKACVSTYMRYHITNESMRYHVDLGVELGMYPYRDGTCEVPCECTQDRVPVQQYIQVPKLKYRYRIYKYQNTGTKIHVLTCGF